MRSRWNPKGYANKVEPSEHDLPPLIRTECVNCGDFFNDEDAMLFPFQGGEYKEVCPQCVPEVEAQR